MMQEPNKGSGSTDKRNNVLLWLLLILLLVALSLFAYLLVQWLSVPSVETRKPLSTVQTHPLENEINATNATNSYAGTYSYGGEPKPLQISHDSILVLTNIGFVVGYSETRKDPLWVCYRLSKVSSLQAPPRPQGFNVDIRTRAKVSQRDYTGSGYDRGHMAPNYAIALCNGSQAQLETFLMSNILPQSPKLNRQVWEHLEEREIKDYAQRYQQLWVIDGPVFKGSVEKLKSGVEIPDACYKILVKEENGQPKLLAFIIPQTVTGLESPSQFVTTVSEIEKVTGLNFFSDLPDDKESRLESESAKGMW